MSDTNSLVPTEKNIAILGNGQSREIFERIENFKPDITIGCNIPQEGIKLDFTACVDAFAVSRAFRANMPHYYRLERGDFKLVLGGRAREGIKGVKAEPGGKETLLEFFKRMQYIHCVIPLFEDAKTIGQRYFSSGHLAFLFACRDYPDSNIHMFGFDSFFTGSASSYTHYSIRRPNDPSPIERVSKKYTYKRPTDTVNSWQWVWKKFWDSEFNTAKSINIYGYDGDPDISYHHEKIRCHFHEKLPAK